ncbi:hypothetical protein LEP1GSC126_1226 [Leptospira kirschneri str. 200801774]|nr:hypothetical protein LEP1GSC122_0123 [Leptospira kirschneri serovar Valbuzzi str. 200702274]EMO80082.1 hypothetical protein LEP1GSC126_1226 [Leptospira kirschneri str. 200801774]
MLSSILILKSYSTCGVGYGRERSAGFPASISFALTYVNLWTAQLNVNSVGSCSEKVV